MKSKNTILRNIMKGEMSLEDESALINNPSIEKRQEQEWNKSKNLSFAEEVDGEKILHFVKSVIWGQNKVIPLYIKIGAVAACLLIAVFLGSTVWFYQQAQKAEANPTFIAINGRQHIESIELSDGSKVSLGAESKLTYPQNFEGNKRLIKLYGQAFFKVAKNPRKPFIVKTDRFTVTALGTAFEVFSFGNKETAETVLLNGKVKVEVPQYASNEKQIFILHPNQKISVNNKGTVVIENVNADDYSKWRDGNGLKFINEKLSVIVPRLRMWYGKDIICDKNIAERYRFTFSIDSETMSEMMQIIDRISPLTVKKEHNVYVITK